MLTLDHLKLQLVRLKPGQRWAQKTPGLIFIIAKGGAGRFDSSAGSQRISPGDVVLVSGEGQGDLCGGSGSELVFWCFALNVEHLFPLFGAKEIPVLQSVLEGLKTPRYFPANTPLATQCHRLAAEVPAQFTLDHRGQLLRLASVILAEEFVAAEHGRAGFVRVEERVIQIFEDLSVDDLVGLSVVDVAKRFGCSRRHLNRLFHQHFGFSVAALRMEMRLLKALTFLRDPEVKIINVAERCGFNHLGLFNTCFRRRFGTSPGKWRQLSAGAKSLETPTTATSPGALPGTSAAAPPSNPSCTLQQNGLCPWSAGKLAAPLPARLDALPEPGAARKPGAAPRGDNAGTAAGACASLLAVFMMLTPMPLAAQPTAQETVRSSLAGNAAAEARDRQLESLPYTFKTGDFRLLLSPSLSFDWNDNINLSKNNALQDYIVTPMLNLKASYPIAQHNLLQFDIGVGYRAYLDHNEYSGLQLNTGSALSLDMFVKDFWINLHDRFSYTQDSSQQAAVSSTGRYGTFQNTAGLNVTWDLQDVTLSLGYDHLNYLATTSQYDYTDHSSEIVSPRVGLRLYPTLTVGVEGAVSFTAYDQKVLNDNTGYNPGVFVEWQPGSYFSLDGRFGYSYYDFRQTSLYIPASNQDAWFADVTLTHRPTDVISYSLSGGHELTLGVYGDTIEDWFARVSVGWEIIKDVRLTAGLSYQNGKQAIGRVGGIEDKFDWVNANLGVGYSITKKLTATLNYRPVWRLSNAAGREYTQNQVGLQLTYLLQ